MRKKDILCRITALMLCMATALSASGCGNSKSSKSGKKKSTTSNVETFDSLIDETPETDSKIDIYLTEDGTPYYIAPDGKKMMLVAFEFTDEEYDPSELTGDGSGEFDYTQNFIRGQYNVDNLSFTVPDGWFADTSFGSPTLFQDYDEGEDINYDMTISIVPTSYIFAPDEDEDEDDGKDEDKTNEEEHPTPEINEETIKTYFDQLVESEFYSGYELMDSGDIKAAGVDAKYYDVFTTLKNEDEEGEQLSYRTRYIITPGDNSHCFILTSLDDDTQFKTVLDAFESFSNTIKLPTAEQMKALDEKAKQEALLDSEEEEEE